MRALSCLSGAVVVEATHGWNAGSIAATLLVDLGARCVKAAIPADRPDGVDGDDGEVRAWRRSLARTQQRGKEPAAVAAPAEMAPLLADADVLIVDGDGYRFLGGEGGWRELGHRYTGLIRCAATPFGLSGPLSRSPATELTVEAAAGILSTTGRHDGPPTRAGFPLGHQAAAVHAAIAVLAAYWQRTRTGERPMAVDIASFDSLFSFLSTFLADQLRGDDAPARFGNHHPLLSPWNTYPTGDGEVVICVSTDRAWQKLFDLIGAAEPDPAARGWSTVERLERRSAVDAIVAEWTAGRTTARAIADLRSAGVPCGPLLGLADMLRDEIVRGRQLITEDADHGDYADLPFTSRPL